MPLVLRQTDQLDGPLLRLSGKTVMVCPLVTAANHDRPNVILGNLARARMKAVTSRTQPPPRMRCL